MAGFALLTGLAANPASAELREYQVTFRPSLSPSVVGYKLHFGFSPGSLDGEYDMGQPRLYGAAYQYRAVIDHDGDLYVSVSAYDAAGATSPRSQEGLVAGSPAAPGTPPTSSPPPSTPPTPPATPPSSPPSSPPPSTPSTPTPQPRADGGSVLPSGAAQLGLAVDTYGSIREIGADGSQQFLTFDSLANTGDVRIARCDLDNDGDEDILLGFGSGSNGRLVRVHLLEGRVHWFGELQAGSAFYRGVDGQTRPACGDVDGDGRDEIVVGFGPSGATRVQVFDDASRDFAPIEIAGRTDGMLVVPQSAPMNPGGLALYPALGDLDGDGRDELVVGFGRDDYAEIAILDDLLSDFAPHPYRTSSSPIVRIDGPHRAVDVGHTHPALGDWDGDGRDEIAVGFGRQSGGWVALIEDARGLRYGSTSIFPMIQLGRLSYRFTMGEIWPSLADVDGDGRAELVAGFSGNASHELQTVSVPTGGTQWLIEGMGGFFQWGERGTQWLIPGPTTAP